MEEIAKHEAEELRKKSQSDQIDLCSAGENKSIIDDDYDNFVSWFILTDFALWIILIN